MMGNVCQPLTTTEGIKLMNSLIKDKKLQRKLVQFKCQCHLGGVSKLLSEVGQVMETVS
jgi:hypothetical protein